MFEKITADQMVAAFWILIAMLAIARWINVLIYRSKTRKADQKAREAFNAEVDRVHALPKLNTEYLMAVPKSLMDKNPQKRTYGTRYNRMFIVDNNGYGWVGLAIPEVLESLKNGEYLLSDYYIPFCGEGEAYWGNPVDMDGFQIDIYPRWMTPGQNPMDWDRWLQIEKKYKDISRAWNYQTGLCEMHKFMEEFRKKHENFQKLRVASKMT